MSDLNSALNRAFENDAKKRKERQSREIKRLEAINAELLAALEDETPLEAHQRIRRDFPDNRDCLTQPPNAQPQPTD